MATTPSGRVEISSTGFRVIQANARVGLRMEWLGAGDATLSGTEAVSGVSNYFAGPVQQWRTGVPHYARVHAANLYPGVDLDYYFQDSRLEFDIHVRPGADPGGMRLAAWDAGSVEIDAAGVLRAPQAYQVKDGIRRPVECRYVRDGDGHIVFWLGEYDRNRELVIDPVVEFLTYLGGSGIDEIQAMAADPAGNVIAAGVTNSANFPGAGAPSGSAAIFVSKLNATGSALVFTSLLGSEQLSNASLLSYIPESVTSLAVDSDGSIYIAGQTFAPNFPVTNGAWQTSSSGYFLARLSAKGDLIYSTYLGPRTWGLVPKRVRAANGVAYVAGNVAAAEFFGTSGAYQRNVAGGSDFFALGMAADGTHPVFLTAVGGSGQDSLTDMAIDGSGNIVLVGGSSSADFPLTADALPYPAPANGGAVMVRLDGTGSRLVSSTWLGATSVNAITGVPDGGVVVGGGSTLPADLIASSPHYSITLTGTAHAWVAKFAGTSNRPAWTSDLSSGDSFTWGISADGQGNIYWPGFPGTSSGGALANGGTSGVAKLAADGSRALYASTVPGGSLLPIAGAANNGSLYFGGYTGAALPTTGGAFQTKLDPAPPGTNQNPLNYYDGYLGLLDLSSFTGDNFFVTVKTALNLTWRIGEPLPAPVTQAIQFNGLPVPITAAPSSRITASYAASPSPALGINVAAGQSAPGTFQESVQLRLPSNPNATLSLPVALTIKPQVSFSLATSQVTIHVRQGQAQLPPVFVSITPNFGSEYFSYTTTSSASWLYAGVNASSGGQPQLEITYAAQNAGTYDGAITVGLQGLQNANASVQVHYVVDPPATIQISTNQVSLHIVKGEAITPAVVNVTSNISGVSWGVFVGVSRTWLKVTESNSATPGQISVTVDPVTVETGYWQFNAFVSGENNQQLVLAIVVDVSSGAPLDAIPNSITYQLFRNGTNGFYPQAVQFTTPGDSTVQWKADQSWISPNSGSVKTPAQVNFAFDTTLKEGVYHGNIVASAGGSNVTIPVTWQLYDTPYLVYSAAPLSFQYTIGGALPAPQQVQITCPTLTPDYFEANPDSFPSFIKVDPQYGSTPATLSVTADPTGLSAGTYQASIRIFSQGYDTKTHPSIPVTLTVVADANAKSSVLQVEDAASYLGGVVAPGEAVIVYGSGLGPASLTQAQPNASGFPMSLAGWSFQFDEFATPILYISDKQSAVMVPFGIAGRSQTQLTVNAPGSKAATYTLKVTATSPGVFSADSSGAGLAAAVNVAADGSVSPNSASSPAARGGIVTVYASGMGVTSPVQTDGALAGAPLPQLNTPVRVLVGGVAANVLYAGPAPGQIAGLTQINFVVPDGAVTGLVPLIVAAGNGASQAGVTVAVK